MAGVISEETYRQYVTIETGKNLELIQTYNPDWYDANISEDTPVSLALSKEWLGEAMKDLAVRLEKAEYAAERWQRNCEILSDIELTLGDSK